MFDWFFEAARPSSLQEGKWGAWGGYGGLDALNLEASLLYRSPHPAAVPPGLQGPGIQGSPYSLRAGPGPDLGAGQQSVLWAQSLGMGSDPSDSPVPLISRRPCRWCPSSVSLLMWKGMEGVRHRKTLRIKHPRALQGPQQSGALTTREGQYTYIWTQRLGH